MMESGGGGVVIVGAGPAGLLLAHLLLSNPRPHLLPVRIFESRGDPCTPLPTYRTRQYSVGLSARGRDAINHVGDLWEAVQEKGVLTSQFVIKTSEAVNGSFSPHMMVRCSRFYDANGKAVLVGDAAHAMSNALGQGCNSSLQDVLVLGKMLQEGEIKDAIEKYSQKQVKEDHAAAYLSEHAFPQAQWLLPFFLLGNILSSTLSKALPSSIIKPSIQSLCSETLVPYSEIVKMHRTWLSFVELTNKLAKVEGPNS